jgi:lysylphosphatidylglycerol synthetase-like protein (DUF2156 family)
MPNLMPDWQDWIRPAGRLLWSLLLTGVGLAFVLALIRPPLERKIVTTRQAVLGSVVVLVVGILAARVVNGLQTVMIWLTLGALFAIAMAAVVSRTPRSPDQQATWAEAMAGATAVFALFTLAYGVVPHEWLTYANSYLNMSTDRFVKWPPWPFYDTVKLPFSAVRDAVAALIYVVVIGINIVLWVRWQQRLQPRPEPAPATEDATVLRTSRFGRPLKARG